MPTDFSAKTVVELRKIAKTYGVTLGAGVSKTDIIAKLVYALGEDFEEDEPAAEAAQETPAAPVAQPAPEAPAPTPLVSREPAPAPVVSREPAPAPAAPSEPAPAAKPAGQPQYHAAWRNPSPTPRYNSRPAYQAPSQPAYQQRPAWQQQPQTHAAPAGGDVPPHIGTVRPANYTPRFGPAASSAPVQSAPQPQREEYRPSYRQDNAPRSFGPRSGEGYGAQPSYQQPRYGQPYEAQSSGDAQPSYQQQRHDGISTGYQRPQQSYARREPGYYNQELGTANPAVSELLAAGDCADGSGTLELHPDGYGFLRSETFLPSSRDIYVSMAQIRRFGLRTGDRVTGKTRPQQGGDKYTAMLYITDVNGVSPDDLAGRASFDDLTPVYPTRRISLCLPEGKTPASMRLVDLVAPIGLGTRGLLLCPPDSGKTELLRDFANVITKANPDITVMVLLIDETPEDVTLFRDQVCCQVLASTFDQAPENHLRLTDMVLERAERLVEQGKDVVILVDSLTRLAKTYTTTAAQQGRAVPGMVNPTSLFRAKRMFGAARCLKEGGSLTMIGAMNVSTGNRVDDTVVEEFKGTANMELVLDAALAHAGIAPAINLLSSGTKRLETLLTPEQLAGVKLVRSTFASTSAANALQQLLPMVDNTATTDELFFKMNDWLELMRSGKSLG